jgi:hypothetical protein
VLLDLDFKNFKSTALISTCDRLEAAAGVGGLDGQGDPSREVADGDGDGAKEEEQRRTPAGSSHTPNIAILSPDAKRVSNVHLRVNPQAKYLVCSRLTDANYLNLAG